MERQDFKDFEIRSGLSARATKEELESIGGRYFVGAGFEKDGIRMVVNQIQYQDSGFMYVWKRIGLERDIGEKIFEIHLEIKPDGYNYYPTIEDSL